MYFEEEAKFVGIIKDEVICIDILQQYITFSHSEELGKHRAPLLFILLPFSHDKDLLSQDERVCFHRDITLIYFIIIQTISSLMRVNLNAVPDRKTRCRFCQSK